MSSQFVQIGLTIIFILLLNQKIAHCRPEYGGYYVQRHELPEIILEEPYYNPDTAFEMRKIDPNDPNFLQNWPYLRDLLPSPYESSTNKLIGMPIPQQQQNRIVDYDMPENMPTALPLQRVKPKLIQKTPFKVQNEKKNANSTRKQYMHSCHFKICNMGRKRDLRFHQF